VSGGIFIRRNGRQGVPQTRGAHVDRIGGRVLKHRVKGLKKVVQRQRKVAVATKGNDLQGASERQRTAEGKIHGEEGERAWRKKGRTLGLFHDQGQRTGNRKHRQRVGFKQKSRPVGKGKKSATQQGTKKRPSGGGKEKSRHTG